jgi:MoxR-like ATPase
MQDEPATLGPKLRALEIEAALQHVFDRNDRIGEQGRRGVPICIWGTHGLGKTEIVKNFARSRGWNIAYCAPAQFEEMGDLHGMPTLRDPTPGVPASGDEYTVFAPPEWVPTKDGPGILLLDDINRADDRILRGIMQLLQNFEMFSWQLPPRWQIVATANPDQGDYSVTPMDDAMLTRMLHLTLVFDAQAWARWAVAAKVDNRGIDFVLHYPETVTGKRTTPRSLAYFFEQIAGIADLKAERDIVAMLASSCLDDTTTAAFLAFVNDDLELLPSPAEILGAADPASWRGRVERLAAGRNGARRVDRLSAICARLFLHVTADGYAPRPKDVANFAEFMLLPEIPNDLRASMMLDLDKSPTPAAKELVKDKRLAKLLLAKL